MADPNDVMDIIRSMTDLVVYGNHEDAVYRCIRGEPYYRMNRVAFEAASWTAGVLSHKNRGRVVDLVESSMLAIMQSDTLFTHTLPCDGEFRYVECRSDADYERKYKQSNHGFTAFIGHTHKPAVYSDDSEKQGDLITINDPDSIIVVPSAGQPRDGNWNVGYARWDSETREMTFRRMGYELAAAQAKVEQAGLPSYLSRRLKGGF
jgi:hypothetical protein